MMNSSDIGKGGQVRHGGQVLRGERASKKYVKWEDYPVGKKHIVFDMLTQIGDKIVVVFPSESRIRKSGISRSVNEYSVKNGKNIKIVYYSKFLVEIEFVGVL